MKLTDYPLLAAEWDVETNAQNGLFLEKVSHGSTKTAAWVCSKGHHFSARIDHRTIMGSGCPYCAGNKPVVGENDLATLFPAIAREWDYSSNPKPPSEYLPQSNKKVSWNCSACGNKYTTSIQHRTQGGGCPKCARKLRGIAKRATAVRQTGSIAQTHPAIANEWDYEKNNSLLPDNVTAGSRERVWWIGKACGHSYDMTVSNCCISGMGCPICAGKRLLVGFNDLATTHPHIAEQWHPIKNGTLQPTDILYGTDRKIWWQCEKGHEWETTPYAKFGCPVCKNKKVLKGFNDLQTTHPDLADEWSEKNSQAPFEVVAGSNQKFWWKCRKCGNEWIAALNDRAQGRGCPQCAKSQRVETRKQVFLETRGSLLENKPELANEWNYEKNGDLTPNRVVAGSTQKVWWKCKYGHHWKASINSRVRGNGCPKCSQEIFTSFPEQCLIFYLKQVTTAENRQKVCGREVDVWLPELNCGIEYNGRYWHRNSLVRDENKAKHLREKGIHLLVIHEGNISEIDGDEIYYRYTSANHFSFGPVVEHVISYLGLPSVDVDVERDSAEIRAKYYQKKEKSIASEYPQLLDAWDAEANALLTPDMVSYGSNQKVWWKCDKCLNSFQASVYTRRKSGCPYCAGKRPIKGVNDLETQYPHLLLEWNWNRNEVSPDTLTTGSSRKVWWRCKNCGHEWETAMKVRTRQGCGCPKCNPFGGKKSTD